MWMNMKVQKNFLLFNCLPNTHKLNKFVVPLSDEETETCDFEGFAQFLSHQT